MRRILILVFLFFSAQLMAQMPATQKFCDSMLNDPKAYAKAYEEYFNINEIFEYSERTRPGNVVLENGYVKYKIKNPQDWPPETEDYIVTQVDIIFTKYPRQKDAWRTNFYMLLSKRLKALFELDSSLNSANFEWNLVLQTKCETELEASKMFHGISIHYVPKNQLISDESADDEFEEYQQEELVQYTQKVNNFINSYGGIKDSTVFKVFDRHPEWRNALVVMDWTGSMHQYAAQAVLWHSLNYRRSGLKRFTFFNDGDQLPDNRKQIGKTGGIYHSTAGNLENLINTFYLVSMNGTGGDSPENDIEAVLKAVEYYDDFDDIILIADNKSCVRDFSLISKLDAKVHVILCGTEKGYNPQYVNLAYLTGGSVHSIEKDIEDLAGKLKDNVLKIDKEIYQLNDRGMLSSRLSGVGGAYYICQEFNYLLSEAAKDQMIFIDSHGGMGDSTVYKVFDRHPLWQDALVVMDWTAGMYNQSSQAVLWQKQNLKKSGIKYYAFFNDGDKLKKRQKRVGKTLGVYYQKAGNLKSVMRKFRQVKKRGDGGEEEEENDLEALIRATSKYKRAENIILIADNQSCIRDMKLIESMNVPVKIVLCNVEGPINPQYLSLAYKTKGSVHTLNDDIYYYVMMTTTKENKPLLIDGINYVLGDDGFYYFADSKQQPSNMKCGKFRKRRRFNVL